MDRMIDITRECFNTLNRIRQVDAPSLPAPQQLHERLRSVIDAMMSEAYSAGHTRDDVDDIAYAVVALADEIAMNKPEPLWSFWMQHQLQVHYFNESTAGDVFFDRLSRIKKDSRRSETLYIYYLCLLFGFQGSYRVRGGELELLKVTEDVRRELTRTRPTNVESLSPHGSRPKEIISGTKRRIPLFWIASGVLVASLLLLFSLRCSLSNQVEDFQERIDALSVDRDSTITANRSQQVQQ